VAVFDTLKCVIGPCENVNGFGPDKNLCAGHASPCDVCGDPWAMTGPGFEMFRLCSQACAGILRKKLFNRADRVEAGLEDKG
jgi:hypothetical protein